MRSFHRQRDVRIAVGVTAALAATLLPAAPAAAAAPAHDDIANAIAVTEVGFTDTLDTSEATWVSSEPECAAATVWYAFTPTESGQVTFDTIGSDFDTALGVFTGEPGDLTWLGCRDDDVGRNEAIRVDVTAGTTYWIEAGSCCEPSEDGQVGPGGSLAFHVKTAPPAVQADATVRRRGVVNRFGTAVVRGSTICTGQAGSAWLAVMIRQRQGARVVAGWGEREVRCDQTRRRWVVRLENDQWAFRPGLARVRATLNACDPFTCDEDTAARVIRLRRP